MVTPFEAGHCVFFNRLRLVMAFFHAIRSMPVAAPIKARGVGAAFIYTPITSRARGGWMIAERSTIRATKRRIRVDLLVRRGRPLRNYYYATTQLEH